MDCSCPLSIYSQSVYFLFTFRGVIQLNNETYIIQPLAGQTSGVSHVTVLINVFSPIKLLTHGLYSLNLRSAGEGVRLRIKAASRQVNMGCSTSMRELLKYGYLKIVTDIQRINEYRTRKINYR